MALCTGCGNEVLDPQRCPVCLAGRAIVPRPKRKPEDRRCQCPRCNEYLEQQDWEGTVTLSCPSCRGTFFPGQSLEQVLNRLRATVDRQDVDAILKDFKDRFTRVLPSAVRYKACPVCGTVMTRRAYATVSGVITDFCGEHGIWVDEAQFAELADFICRGGDVLASKATRTLDRATPRAAGRDSSLLDRLLGG
jgi:Zn-finger nucleic acid-binding protein